MKCAGRGPRLNPDPFALSYPVDHPSPLSYADSVNERTGRSDRKQEHPRRNVSGQLVVAVTAGVCTVVMGLLLARFGSRTDYWGLLVPGLFLVFYLSWRSVTATREPLPGIPYSILLLLISALILMLDLEF